MNMRILRIAKVRELIEEINSSLDIYRNGDFSYLSINIANYFETKHEINGEMLSAIYCDEDDDREVENCKIIHKAMNGLSPYLARDERIWVYLSHTELLEYSRKRWPIPDDDDKVHIPVKNAT